MLHALHCPVDSWFVEGLLPVEPVTLRTPAMSSAANMVSRVTDVSQWCGVVMFVTVDRQWADAAAAVRRVVIDAGAASHGEPAP
ncbi:hypothetical protein [Immundisolibacter sp.]